MCSYNLVIRKHAPYFRKSQEYVVYLCAGVCACAGGWGLLMDGCWEGKQTGSWDPAVGAMFHRHEPPGGIGRRLHGLLPPTTLSSILNASYCLLVAVLLEMNPSSIAVYCTWQPPPIDSGDGYYGLMECWWNSLDLCTVKSLKCLDNTASKLGKVNAFYHCSRILSLIIYSSQRFSKNRFFF